MIEVAGLLESNTKLCVTYKLINLEIQEIIFKIKNLTLNDYRNVGRKITTC